MISHLNDVRTFKTKIAAVGLFEMDVVSTLWIRIDFTALFLEFSPINIKKQKKKKNRVIDLIEIQLIKKQISEKSFIFPKSYIENK